MAQENYILTEPEGQDVKPISDEATPVISSFGNLKGSVYQTSKAESFLNHKKTFKYILATTYDPIGDVYTSLGDADFFLKTQHYPTPDLECTSNPETSAVATMRYPHERDIRGSAFQTQFAAGELDPAIPFPVREILVEPNTTWLTEFLPVLTRANEGDRFEAVVKQTSWVSAYLRERSIIFNHDLLANRGDNDEDAVLLSEHIHIQTETSFHPTMIGVEAGSPTFGEVWISDAFFIEDYDPLGITIRISACFEETKVIATLDHVFPLKGEMYQISEASGFLDESPIYLRSVLLQLNEATATAEIVYYTDLEGTAHAENYVVAELSFHTLGAICNPSLELYIVEHAK